MKEPLSEKDTEKVVGGAYIEYTFEKIPDPNEYLPEAGWVKIYADGAYLETQHFTDENDYRMIVDIYKSQQLNPDWDPFFGMGI